MKKFFIFILANAFLWSLLFICFSIQGQSFKAFIWPENLRKAFSASVIISTITLDVCWLIVFMSIMDEKGN